MLVTDYNVHFFIKKAVNPIFVKWRYKANKVRRKIINSTKVKLSAKA
jgi:hypothetical protein